MTILKTDVLTIQWSTKSFKLCKDQAALCFYFLNITIREFSLNKAAGFNLPPFTKTSGLKGVYVTTSNQPFVDINLS